MIKLDPTERMMRLASIVADSVIIPEHCTLERDDIYQEVCLIYLERGYTQNPGVLKERVITAIMNYIESYGCEIACGLLKEVIDYRTEASETAAAISAVAATSIEKVLKLLTPREERVLCYHFGIGEDALNFDDIGKIFNVGGTRCSQIEAKAIRKLRHPSRYQYLRNAIEMVISDEYFV